MEPKDYGLPHNEFLPGQEGSIKWAKELKKKVGILESPTGTGKTGVASAMKPFAQMDGKKVISLTNTKLLQQDNYERGYDFFALYGQGNYQCVLPAAPKNATFRQCRYRATPNRCPSSNSCPYLIAQRTAKSIDTVGLALNYAYWVQKYQDWEPKYLFMDEGHRLSDVTIGWAGVEITEWEIKNFNLPKPPVIMRSDTITNGKEPKEALIFYLRTCVPAIREFVRERKRIKSHKLGLMNIIEQAEMLILKIENSVELLSSSYDDWYVFSNKKKVRALPYSAQHYFKKLLSTTDKTIIMSATIGDVNAFSAELGIWDYEFRTVESPYPIESRPIVDLGLPPLGYKSSPKLWDKQARVISKEILDRDPEWYGLIHTTSKQKAADLAIKLDKYGLGHRIWVPEYDPTDVQITKWQNEMMRKPGAIAITWAWWEGYDGTKEQINIVAKTPYPYLGDPFEKERQARYPEVFMQRTAYSLIQGLGRTRRSPEDYNTEDQENGFVAIADGSFRYNVSDYIPEYILNSIVR